MCFQVDFRMLISRFDTLPVTEGALLLLSKSDDPQKDVRREVENVLGYPLDDGHRIRIVRNVSPNKEMLCVVFVLHKEVLFSSTEPPEKKAKLT